FPSRLPVKGVTARLVDGQGKEVDFWVSTPEKPLNPNKPLRSIYLVPREPLNPETTYEVTISAEVLGEPWNRSWKFTTAKKTNLNAEELGRKILADVNAFRNKVGLQRVSIDNRLSQGCQQHARYLVINFDHPSVKGLGMHNEDPRLPGATLE